MRTVLGDRVMGICDTPIGLMRRAAGTVATLSPGTAPSAPGAGQFDYVGLNHLGWLRSLELDGVDRLPTLLADDTLLTGIEEARLMGLDWVRALGALPNEYLYYYYFTREATARISASPPTRGEFLRDQQAAFYRDAARPEADPLAAWNASRHERESTYMAESRPEGKEGERHEEDAEGGYHQVALDLMAALATDRPATMILDVRNGDLVPQLPEEAVIEVGCVVDGNGVHPWKVAPGRGSHAGPDDADQGRRAADHRRGDGGLGRAGLEGLRRAPPGRLGGRGSLAGRAVHAGVPGPRARAVLTHSRDRAPCAATTPVLNEACSR